MYNYILDGRYNIDNNLIESKIREFALGKKNWNHCGSPRGARATATYFSLIISCKNLGINPLEYMHNILLKAPYCKTDEDYLKLMPGYDKAVELGLIKEGEVV